MNTGKSKGRAAPSPLLVGLIFGIVFGFLLQKGGVGKFHILIGQLLLQDFTVVKVMMTAVAVGMVGVFVLHALGKVELQVKKTRYAANSIGGLIFGAGFALAAYCPGTNMVALGQGNWDAVAVAAGLIVGSYLFALAADWLERTVLTWGDRGKVMLPQLLKVNPTVFALCFAAALVVGLFLLEQVTTR
jgi:uncharacterized protein